ncbi:peroxiredoxin, Ohr subfamily [Bradyrhizobium brasilense]|uniref:Peroxiredoxin, Ohr subfamily n=1 Tax=Bradyrhizobium brasilense TaxID=1419277 RepID=A0A1G7LWS7_9BRAD|nr:Ohr family peroxiredoxin [Bradyrhizobium brasilense]SDF53893.1 peroxiredoxin, Ohr subfamily [Bradyrhizobium brasilense]
MTATAKVLVTGKTHVTAGPNGAARSRDGFLDVKLPQPHPAAENLFAVAWSACYIGAIQLAAGQRKVKLASEPEVDAEIDLNQAGSAFFLSARLNVHVPGVEREVAQELIEAAHGICPYSKAVHGNIDVTTTLV